MESIRRATREGASDARLAAGRFLDGASLFASRFTYTTCYTLSYGVTFPAVLISRTVPRDNEVVRGFIAGSKAATEKVEQIVTR